MTVWSDWGVWKDETRPTSDETEGAVWPVTVIWHWSVVIKLKLQVWRLNDVIILLPFLRASHCCHSYQVNNLLCKSETWVNQQICLLIRYLSAKKEGFVFLSFMFPQSNNLINETNIDCVTHLWSLRRIFDLQITTFHAALFGLPLSTRPVWMVTFPLVVQCDICWELIGLSPHVW